MSSIRNEPKIVNCILIQFRGGENIVIGEYRDYDAAYKAACQLSDDQYAIFKTIETFTRTREISLRVDRRTQDAKLMADRDAEAITRAAMLKTMSDEELDRKINDNGMLF